MRWIYTTIFKKTYGVIQYVTYHYFIDSDETESPRISHLHRDRRIKNRKSGT